MIAKVNTLTKEITFTAGKYPNASGDDLVQKLDFVLDRYTGNGVDLGESDIYVYYTNGRGDTYSHPIPKHTNSEDGLYVLFTWNFAREVSDGGGNTKFSVSAKSIEDGKIVNEWNSEVATLPVIRSIGSRDVKDADSNSYEELEVMLSEFDDTVNDHISAFLVESSNKMKTFSDEMDEKVLNADKFSNVSERYAKGSEDGTAVTSGIGFHDNALYYKDLADGFSNVSERYAKGTEDGEDVTSGVGYHDNAKYWKEQVEASAHQIIQNQVDIAAQTARIDNIASLPSGTTSADAELIDIRTGVDGVTRTNAGTAVRQQIDNLVRVQPNEPTTPITRVWLDSDESTSIEVPTYEEFGGLTDRLDGFERDLIRLAFNTAARNALLKCLYHVAWADNKGLEYYEELQAALDISVISISAEYTQTRTIYDTSILDDLRTDLVVTALFSDGTSRPVGGYTLSGELTAGERTITVTFRYKTATFNVTVTHMQGQLSSIYAQMDQTALITTDNTLEDLRQHLTVTAHYDGGEDIVVTGYTLSGSLVEGQNTITVAYSNKTTTFSVNVVRGTYLTATFDAGGNTIYVDEGLEVLKQYLTVTVTYYDGTSEVVNNYELSGTLTDGQNTITVSYNGKSTTFTVTAVDFYNIWEWDSESTGANALYRLLTSCMERAVDGVKRGIYYASNGVANNNRRSFYVNKGKQVMIDNNGNPTIFYPVPIPKTATKLTATITPSTQQFASYVFKYKGEVNPNGYDYSLVAPSQISWKTGQDVVTFDASDNLFVAFNCRKNASNAKYAEGEEPTMHILFE